MPVQPEPMSTVPANSPPGTPLPLLELPVPDPLPGVDAAHQLAADEACLEAAEAGELGESLRLWELPQPVVVIGRGSKFDVEVHREHCRIDQVAVLRRCSGGAAIVAGPGCLMYSLVLDMDNRPELRKLDAVHQFVMGNLATAIGKHLREVQMQGTCDLTWRNRKFSGNSLRVARRFLLYHGTLLYAADLSQIGHYLRMPPRRPDYRQDRDHDSFVTNVPMDRELLYHAVRQAFGTADTPLELSSDQTAQLRLRIERLLGERYANPQWHQRH